MNKNSTPVGKRIIMLTISYLFFAFAAQANSVADSNLVHSKVCSEIRVDSISLSHQVLDITVTNRSVDLFWETNSELQNDHYEVERSFDMKSFKTVGLVLGPIASDGQLSQYGFRDDARNIKNHNAIYYRLKQVDIEGKATYGVVKAYRVERL